MKGITPVVATVLLIAIAVIAGVSVWFWVSPFTGKPPMAETNVKSFTIVNVYKNVSGDGCSGIDIKNTGGQSISNPQISIYSLASGQAVGKNGTSPQFSAYINITGLGKGASSFFCVQSLGYIYTNFTEKNITTLPSSSYSLDVGDADNDGLNEIIVGLRTLVINDIRMYKNMSGGWIERNISENPVESNSLAIGDADNDGLNEIVAGLDVTTNELRMYKNTSGGWVTTNISDFPVMVWSVDIGDADNDGLNEVMAGLDVTTGFELKMFENKSGGWVETNISNLPVESRSVTIGDANNDGFNETVIGLESTTNELRMYTNASGGWIEKNISDLPARVYSVKIGDADNDGLNEIVVGLSSSTSEIMVFDNISGGWTGTTVIDAYTTVYSVAIGDADNDGDNEIASVLYSISAMPNEVRIYENMTGRWVETNISDTSDGIYPVYIGDADNDGLNEVTVVVASGTNNLKLYEKATTLTTVNASIPVGTYLLRTSVPGYSDQKFTCS